MSNRYIEENVKRKLYAESMGRCMNPGCQQELFRQNGDIIEKAHIDSYCATADNSYENLVLLCPNCHTDFDKNQAFTPDEVLGWKKIRREELERFFSKRQENFEDLKKEVYPLLIENKTIYENYYLKDSKALWNKFEPTILANNRKLKKLLLANLDLIQRNSQKEHSNLSYVQLFIAHINEFEETRGNEEKNRCILFPTKINSIFGVAPVSETLLPSTESLELLIKQLKEKGLFKKIVLGIEHPYIQIIEAGKINKIFLDDTPMIRQLYHNYNCFRGAKVRLESLNYALKHIRSRNVDYCFLSDDNLREIRIKNQKLIFVYEYCLSQACLMQFSPDSNCIIVNLHNWNGESCISKEAYELAKSINIKLLTMSAFYEYINDNK